MKLVTNGVHVDLGNSFQSYVENAFNDFNERHFKEPIEANVQVSKNNYQFQCDISSHIIKSIFIRSQGSGATVYQAFDNALKNLNSRVRRHKKRLDSHNKQSHEREMAPYYVLSLDQADHTPDNDLAPPVIAEMEAEVPKLTVGDAVMKLDLTNQRAMLFYNISHGNLNMVYRRDDGNIGWVDPKIG